MAIVIAGAAGIFFYKPPHPSVNIKKENNKMRELIKMYYKNQERIKAIKNTPKPKTVKSNLNIAKIKPLHIHKKIIPATAPKVVRPQKAAGNVKTIYGNKDLVPTVSLRVVRKPLWKVLEKLNERTGYYFITKHINLAKVVSIDTKKENLATALNKLFRKTCIYIYPDRKEVVITIN